MVSNLTPTRVVRNEATLSPLRIEKIKIDQDYNGRSSPSTPDDYTMKMESQLTSPVRPDHQLVRTSMPLTLSRENTDDMRNSPYLCSQNSTDLRTFTTDLSSRDMSNLRITSRSSDTLRNQMLNRLSKNKIWLKP